MIHSVDYQFSLQISLISIKLFLFYNIVELILNEGKDIRVLLTMGE